MCGSGSPLTLLLFIYTKYDTWPVSRTSSIYRISKTQRRSITQRPLHSRRQPYLFPLPHLLHSVAYLPTFIVFSQSKMKKKKRLESELAKYSRQKLVVSTVAQTHSKVRYLYTFFSIDIYNTKAVYNPTKKKKEESIVELSDKGARQGKAKKGSWISGVRYHDSWALSHYLRERGKG